MSACGKRSILLSKTVLKENKSLTFVRIFIQRNVK